jgi:flagellar biosynthesis protein FlhG
MFGGKRLKDAVVRGPGGIRIIPGGSGRIEMTKLGKAAQKKLMEQFEDIEDIDVLLIDTGAGISMNQLSFITFAQEVILITTPEPTAITDVYSVIKIISDLKIKRKIQLIVNKASSDKMGRLTYMKLNKTAKSFLNVELEYMGHVADDARVGNSVMKQVPFILNYPNCLASQCIDNMAGQIVGVPISGAKIKTMSEVYNRLMKSFG